MNRRKFLTAGLSAGTALAAGCTAEQLGNGGGDDADADTISVATTQVFVDGPGESAGPWVEEQFEEETGYSVEWDVRDQGINYYIERHNEGVGIDQEVYLNVRPHDLVRIDEATEDDLFVPTDTDHVPNVATIGDEFYFDPHDRVIPTWLSYCSLVYDGRNIEPPETFEDLVSEAYRGDFALSNPQEGTTGLLFMLWTINEFGEDGYLEFWNDLLDNDARILDGWSDVYPQFIQDEVNMIVSYSNDRVYARADDQDLDKHQVGFLNGQGYANMLGVARFADGTNDDIAHEFMNFVLEPEIQAGVAERNVTGPVNEETVLPEVYAEYAEHPDETVFLDYDELRGNLSGWLTDWGREIAGGR